MRSGDQRQRRFRRRGTALAGLLALVVQMAAFSLASVMPISTALAAAEAEPFEIVICTVHGPVVMDARDLGITVSGDETPDIPRNACDLAMQATAAFALDTSTHAIVWPVTYEDTRVVRATGSAPAYTAPLMRSAPPRAPPHTS
ncbi:MAG: hypothetical protein R8J41_02500 [Alphaproteobacteria bacterium]|nr:hypothetical protein [Alphaproteobacteria bacterium]